MPEPIISELFIYYRARGRDETALETQVSAWQRSLEAQHPGLRARLLRRYGAASDADLATWMETYAMPVGGAFDASLSTLLAAGPPDLAPLLVGERHVEAFVPCAS